MSFPLSLVYLAGVVTALSPCILPLLPAMLGSGLQERKTYPLGLALGFIISSSALGAGFSAFGNLLGVTKSSLENFAVIMLAVAGFILLIPPLHDRISFFLSRRTHISSEKPDRKGPHFIQAILSGTLLGFLWLPCVGPILAAILSLGASQETLKAFFLLLVYGLGVSTPLLFLAYGGRLIAKELLKVRPYTVLLQQILGGMLLFTAILYGLGGFQKIAAWLVPHVPDWITRFY